MFKCIDVSIISIISIIGELKAFVMIDAARKWIMHLYDADKGAFRFSPYSHPCLLGACCAVLASETLGILNTWSRSDTNVVIRYIQSFQREDGWFVDPYLKPQESTNLDENYLRGHTTFLAMMALDALKKRPHYALKFLEQWSDDDALYKWIDQLDWRKPWRESNRVEWIGYWILANADLSIFDVPIPRDRWPKGFGGLIQWLKDHQDSVTGYWGDPSSEGQQRILNQMIAAYHHYVFYYAIGKPIPYQEKIVDHTLSLQQPDGLFKPGQLGGGPCEDLDAIDILANMFRITDYCHEEIKQVLNKAVDALIRNQRDNGAFVYTASQDDSLSFFGTLRIVFKLSLSPGPFSRLRIVRKYVRRNFFSQLDYYAGACMDIPFRRDGGDMFFMWFRPLAIAIAVNVLGKDLSPIWWDFGFRRQITHGWWPGSVKMN